MLVDAGAGNVDEAWQLLGPRSERGDVEGSDGFDRDIVYIWASEDLENYPKQPAVTPSVIGHGKHDGQHVFDFKGKASRLREGKREPMKQVPVDDTRSVAILTGGEFWRTRGGKCDHHRVEMRPERVTF